MRALCGLIVDTIGEVYSARRGKTLLLILVAALVAASAVIPPFILGAGVLYINDGSLPPRAPGEKMVIVVAAYIAVWGSGQVVRYYFLPVYGGLEQDLQNRIALDYARQAIAADESVGHEKNSSDLAYAIDSAMAAKREIMSGVFLSWLPAGLMLSLGAALIFINVGFIQGIIFVLFVALALGCSFPLINRHQRAQSEFFSENMKSFSVLENGISLWREAKIMGSSRFIEGRLFGSRLAVKKKGMVSYRVTRQLHIIQYAIILSGMFTICVVSLGDVHDPVTTASRLVSTVGLVAAAVIPLQNIGFTSSQIVESAARFSRSTEKINRLGTTKNNTISRFIESHKDSWDGLQNHTQKYGIVWVLGPSGAGKTTYLELILGLIKAPDSCHSTAGPKIPHGLSGAYYSPQESNLLMGTVHENIDFGRQGSTAEIDKLLDGLNLADFSSSGDRYREQISAAEGGVSGGQAKRISLARALFSVTGSLVVLDEPTAGLHRQVRHSVWRAIREASHHNLLIVSTHDDDAPIADTDTVVRF